MAMPVVYNFRKVRRGFELARWRRIRYLIAGDSNAIAAGDSGYFIAHQAAWLQRLDCWGTGIHGTGENGGNALDYHFNGGYILGPSSVPSPHAIYVPPGAVAGGSARIGPGEESNFDWHNALLLNTHPKAAQALRWHFSYGTYASGGGSAQATARYESTGTFPAYGSVINATTGTNGFALGSLDVPAGSTAGHVLFNCQRHSAFGFTGPQPASVAPWVTFYQTLEFKDTLQGVATTCFLYQGGQGTRAAAIAVQDMTDSQYAVYYAMLAAGQVGDPVAIVHLMQGGNDTGDSTLSVGPNPAASNTYNGFIDNVDAFWTAKQEKWATAGGRPENLFLVVGGYHSQEESRREWRLRCDERLAAWSDTVDRVCILSSSRIATTAHNRHQGWHAESAPTDAHLTSVGYHGVTKLNVNTLLPTPSFKASHAAGGTVYARLFDQSGQVYSVTHQSFGPWADADVADYALEGVQDGTSPTYTFTIPKECRRAAIVTARIYAQAGMGPDVSDPAADDSKIGPMYYDGTRILSRADLDQQAEAIAAEDAAASAGLGAEIDEVQDTLEDVKDKTDLITGDTTYSGPVEVTPDGIKLRLVAGDDYTTTGRKIVMTFTGYTGPSLTAGSLRLSKLAAYRASGGAADAPAEAVTAATPVTVGTTVTFTAELTEAQTTVLSVPKDATIGAITHMWQIVGEDAAGKPQTFKFGYAYVTRNIAETV